MDQDVAVVGIGSTAFRSLTPELSYRELIYEAAVRAYIDAGVDPRTDVDSFVTLAEDFSEGTSIFDEYTPDQIGGAMRPVHTITADGLFGVAAGVMQILTGEFEIVVVEGHSKASNLLTPHYVTAYGLDPIYNRPLNAHPNFIAGMEKNRYLFESGTSESACAKVCVKNYRNALGNPLAPYGSLLQMHDVLDAPKPFYPLSDVEIARPSDGAIVVVLASAKKAKDLNKTPIWIRGIGWCSDSPSLETRDWGKAVYAQKSAEMAYRQAGITNPAKDIQLAELDDSFSFKELMHIEAVGLCGEGEAQRLTENGLTERTGRIPVNVSGGSLGLGNLGEATGLAKIYELVTQLRGEAGARQVPNVRIALAQSWRGIPSPSGASVVLGV